jgi:hypothetical protein
MIEVNKEAEVSPVDPEDEEAGRPFGYGNVDARPPIDGSDRPADAEKAAEASGRAGGGESGGRAYPNRAAKGRPDPGGQSEQRYFGSEEGAEENAASTRKAAHDRSS